MPSISMYDPPIGGYFELELPRTGGFYHQSAFRYQSARAAFSALLQQQQVKRIWMPKYICNAMLLPLEEANIECNWYDISDEFDIVEDFVLNKGECLLFANYFGVCDKKADAVLDRFPARRVVMDFSQAFFSSHRKRALATIYSPRKFFGVPDGGLLVTGAPVSVPDKRDDGSIGRAVHLLKRLGDTPESGFKDYQAAEGTLRNCEPQKMSKFTEALLRSIDYAGVIAQRRKNFSFLHERLHKSNLLNLVSDAIRAPLCYPYLTENEHLREKLLGKRIFLPTYWDDAARRVGKDWAQRMIKGLLPIPLDHRYGRSAMARVAELILEDN